MIRSISDAIVAEKIAFARKQCQIKDAFDVGNKSHIQHTVSFVDNHDLDAS